ncbi:MAG: hypothetical protein A4E52_01121 [Pelotomaculum sp. PtaB.Bin013]|nr:MAG: hypothetical protein A4E52_01121 [Pelotomaculum sp. PtaB.Bin013]
MTSYKEVLRLHSLGINNTRIASGCGCSRTTVINVLQKAKDQSRAKLADGSRHVRQGVVATPISFREH